MSATAGIQSLHDELVEVILSYIDSFFDLRSLALTSHSFASVIFPRHSEYRVISLSTWQQPEIWYHLSNRPDLARNVRILQIGPPGTYESSERTYRVPVTLVNAPAGNLTNVGAEQTFGPALRQMQYLQQFEWREPWLALTSAHIADVFSSLSCCVALTHLTLCDRRLESGALTLEVDDCPVCTQASLSQNFHANITPFSSGVYQTFCPFTSPGPCGLSDNMHPG